MDADHSSREAFFKRTAHTHRHIHTYVHTHVAYRSPRRGIAVITNQLSEHHFADCPTHIAPTVTDTDTGTEKHREKSSAECKVTVAVNPTPPALA